MQSFEKVPRRTYLIRKVYHIFSGCLSNRHSATEKWRAGDNMTILDRFSVALRTTPKYTPFFSDHLYLTSSLKCKHTILTIPSTQTVKITALKTV